MSRLAIEPNLRSIIVPAIVRTIPVTIEGKSKPAAFQWRQ